MPGPCWTQWRSEWFLTICNRSITVHLCSWSGPCRNLRNGWAVYPMRRCARWSRRVSSAWSAAWWETRSRSVAGCRSCAFISARAGVFILFGEAFNWLCCSPVAPSVPRRLTSSEPRHWQHYWTKRRRWLWPDVSRWLTCPRLTPHCISTAGRQSQLTWRTFWRPTIRLCWRRPWETSPGRAAWARLPRHPAWPAKLYTRRSDPMQSRATTPSPESAGRWGCGWWRRRFTLQPPKPKA